MEKKFFESTIGLITIVVLTLFCIKANTIFKNAEGIASYKTYNATFTNIEGVTVGSEIKIGGVKIGKIKKIAINEDLFIKVELIIKDTLKIPNDSRLSISSSGILGGKYLEIKPGSSEQELMEGEFFRRTQSTINLEDLISKFAFKK